MWKSLYGGVYNAFAVFRELHVLSRTKFGAPYFTGPEISESNFCVMTIHFRHSTVNESMPHKARVTRSLHQRRHGFYRVGGKMIFDWLLVLASLPVTLPLVGLLALLVALDGSAPFYRQWRIGRNGKAFRMLKIRTMVPDAEHILQEYLDKNRKARDEWEHKQKLCHDPRVTRLGCFLRKSSIDELPQLWNVLRGDMSLIGPRPMMLDQRDLYPGSAYYHMRPGITGLWQVSDRNESGFSERATFDAEYYNDLSLKTDLSIFMRTIGTVLRGTGY